MIKNLHAVGDFVKGDLGHVSGHRALKATGPDAKGGSLVIALQDVKAGTNGWFETQE